MGLVVASAVGALSTSAAAQIRGEIIGPGATRMPIAVPDLRFLGGREREEEAREFIRVLRADLELSGLFRVIDPAAYLVDPAHLGLSRDEIRFEDWTAIGALGLLTGGYQGNPGGITIEARFFDVADRSSSGGRRLSGDDASFARLAHRMADAVLEFVTGTPGPFDSRIAFVSDRSGRFRELYSLTFERRVRQLTRHNSITMAPSWHPSVRSLLFTSFRGGRPVLYSVDYDTGTDSRLASKMGVNVGGVWSPDGKLVLVAREEAGNTDIFALDLARSEAVRLTDHWGIDVDPGWSPDGGRIVFCSSRSGAPQIYTMAVDGSDVRRLTLEGSYNCAPAWSPDGRLIAYAGRTGGGFQIFVVPATGGRARQITSAGSNEDPSWSPDSRYLAFSSKRGKAKKIYMVDVQSGFEVQLTDGAGDDTSPTWSRRLD
jgi:TolB protein